MARYFMFRQVNFLPVRLAYNKHAVQALKSFLTARSRRATLPNPSTTRGRASFLELDDWRVLSWILDTRDDPDSAAIVTHGHDRMIHETTELPTLTELKQFKDRMKRLQKQGIECWAADASKDWYTLDATPILVAGETGTALDVPVGTPLSQLSAVVGGLKPTRQQYLFVSIRDKVYAKKALEGKIGGKHGKHGTTRASGRNRRP